MKKFMLLVAALLFTAGVAFAEGKSGSCGAGKCGDSKKEMKKSGSCGAGKCGSSMSKDKSHGKQGEMMKKSGNKASGSCGAGKCGGDMKKGKKKDMN